MANSGVDPSRDFLRSAQRGDLDKLKELSGRYEIQDWTVYRHDSTGDTALHIAAREGHLEIAKCLCNDWSYPAFKVDVTNKDMKRPLHEASQFAHSDIVEFLIDQGAEVDALKRADWTPLMLACTKSGPDAKISVNALLKAGANPIIRNKDGWTPLLLACRAGDVSIIKTLLQQPLVVATTASNNGRTALHIAVSALLSAEPGLIGICDSSGSTPLHESVKSQNFKVFECLMKFGADVRQTDGVGQTILHLAATVGNCAVVQHIVRNKLIDFRCRDNYGATPLVCAQRSRMESIVGLLQKFEEEQSLI
ncbi:ankyrin repeat domain-containing protein 16 isoform X2 [Diachasma alloeum]|uniref:ankyrin repeat domain-containing protein 16 isoform X2 n=1 Tax=Diachasma alloeum TaxID=454923 RepID=UPI00073826A3|nr:ankyrin repeat domain-containing protein 16 isoform X2 [Diachasma alloeum]